MVIASLMLGIVIPTFHKLTKGISVEMAARQLGGQLKAVREYAITNREYVALIMGPIHDANNTLPVGYHGIAYRPCIYNSSSGEFTSWVYGERWEFLPEGSELYSISTSTTVNKVNLSDIGAGDEVNDIDSIVFTPTGKCLGASAAPIDVKIVDSAVVDEDGDEDGKKYKDKKAVNITVAAYTGRVSYGED